MQEVQKAVLTIGEAAAYLGLKKSYVYKLLCKGKIPYYKPTGGRVIFKPSELESFLFRNRMGGEA